MALTEWWQDILTTPFGNNLSLAKVGRDDRVDEMEFHFPLESGPALIRTLQAAGYARDIDAGSLSPIEGMMTGMIDIVFRQEGRYYLVDYKSNHLGMTTEAYSETGVRQAVAHHHYDIQYLIYTVALHRYLRANLAAYRYEEHFGGVYYLFLRGMNGEHNAGVFEDAPPLSLVDELDRVRSDG